MRFHHCCFVLAIALGAMSWVCHAQGDLILLLDPEIGGPRIGGAVHGEHHFREDVRDQPFDFRMSVGGAQLWFKPWHDESTEIIGTADYTYYDIDTRARLDGSYRRIPGRFENIGFGLGFRHKLDNDWMTGALVKVGSSSDKPFDSSDEVYGSGIAFLRVPHTGENAWLFLLAGNSNSSVPVVPGFGYLFKKGNWQGGIGIPFAAVYGQPTEKFRVFASYIPVNEVNVDLSYQVLTPVLLFAGFQWQSDYFRRADRRRSGDILEFSQKRLRTGARLYLSPDTHFELAGGYAFDRQFGEGDGWSDRGDNRFKVEDGWFAGLSFQGRF